MIRITMIKTHKTLIAQNLAVTLLPPSPPSFSLLPLCRLLRNHQSATASCVTTSTGCRLLRDHQHQLPPPPFPTSTRPTAAARSSLLAAAATASLVP